MRATNEYRSLPLPAGMYIPTNVSTQLFFHTSRPLQLVKCLLFVRIHVSRLFPHCAHCSPGSMPLFQGSGAISGEGLKGSNSDGESEDGGPRVEPTHPEFSGFVFKLQVTKSNEKNIFFFWGGVFVHALHSWISFALGVSRSILNTFHRPI